MTLKPNREPDFMSTNGCFWFQPEMIYVYTYRSNEIISSIGVTEDGDIYDTLDGSYNGLFIPVIQKIYKNHLSVYIDNILLDVPNV